MRLFRRKPAQPDIDLGREELRKSQLTNTMKYGWQESGPANDQDVLRESLERHEDDLAARDEHPPK
jgi:hypothetical protein